MRLAATFFALISLAACDVAEPNELFLPPYLGDSGIPVMFSVPDTVSRGVPFDVSFTYRGSSSCTRGIQIASHVEGNVVTLESLVRVLNAVCTLDLTGFRATQTLQLNSAGVWQIRLHGQFDSRDTVVVRTTIVR